MKGSGIDDLHLISSQPSIIIVITQYGIGLLDIPILYCFKVLSFLGFLDSPLCFVLRNI